ncbi:MAG: C39 family peptidase [Kiritimatiellae bacterium]|nr:C39 family peptidase [Kiritimatiellia bacterium]
MPTDPAGRRASRRAPAAAAPSLLAAAALLAAALVSCNTPPSARNAKLSVPFIPQPPDHCGAVALAMVERYYGAKPDLAALLAYVQIPALSGTIPDLLAEAARRNGFDAELRTLDPMQIHALLLAGQPLILLLGPDPETPGDPRGHFLVATGYRPATRALRAHTGYRENTWLPETDWLPRYRAAGSTALVLAPPADAAAP